MADLSNIEINNANSNGLSKHFWPCAIIALLVVLIYGQVYQQQFINYDDNWFITQNPTVLQGFTFQSISWSFGLHTPSQWHPLTWLSYLTDVEISRRLHGINTPPDAMIFKLHNLLWHLAGCFLLYGILYRLSHSVWKSFAVAALVAVHPLNVDSVAWIAERKNLLCNFFSYGTIAIYSWYVAKPCLRRYLLLAFGFALALMSKPMAITLPCVLLLLDYWPLDRLGKQPCFKRFVQLVLEKIPLLTMALIASWFTILVHRHFDGIESLASTPFSSRFFGASVAYTRYLHKLIWPTNLAIFYPYVKNYPISLIIESMVLFLVITSVAFWRRKKEPYLLVGWLWFVGTLLPVIGLVQVGSQSIADRYMYLPAIGFFIMLVWAIGDLISHYPKMKKSIVIITSFTLLLLTQISYRQTAHWQNSKTIFTQSLLATGGSHIAHHHLALVYQQANQLPQAVQEYQKALAFYNLSPEIHNNFGTTLARLGKLDQAIKQFQQALVLKPQFPSALKNLATAKKLKLKTHQFKIYNNQQINK